MDAEPLERPPEAPVLPPRPLRLARAFYLEVLKALALLWGICLGSIALGLAYFAQKPFASAVCLLIGLGLCATVSWAAWRRTGLARACAAKSEELELIVVDVSPLRTSDGAMSKEQFDYTYLVPSVDGRSVQAERGALNPLVVEREGNPRVIALRSPSHPGQLLYPTQSLFPFEVGEEDAARVRARLFVPTGPWTRPD